MRSLNGLPSIQMLGLREELETTQNLYSVSMSHPSKFMLYSQGRGQLNGTDGQLNS